MNILIAAKYATTKSGNFIASLLELSLQLKDQGHFVYFMFPKAAQERSEWLPWLKENGFEVILFDDKQNSKNIFQDLQLYIQQYNINLIHCHFGFCLKELSLNIHKFPGVKLLIHDHMDYSPDKNIPAQYIKQWLLSLIFRVQGIGVISVMKKKSAGYWLCKKKQVWFVPNGLSLLRNIERPKTREEMRKQLGISDDEQLILLLGWNMNLKGVDIAIRAVEELRQINPKVQLGFLGLGEKPALYRCEWIKEKTGIDPLKTPWLRFFPDAEDIFACHMAADTYLSASRREAFSYGLLESISQNVPTVVSNIPGTSWALAYNKCFSYSVEDPSECAKALERALSMRFDESNSDELVSRYNIDTWCSDVISIYHKMMK